jgi:hypothetical protein
MPHSAREPSALQYEMPVFCEARSPNRPARTTCFRHREHVILPHVPHGNHQDTHRFKNHNQLPHNMLHAGMAAGGSDILLAGDVARGMMPCRTWRSGSPGIIIISTGRRTAFQGGGAAPGLFCGKTRGKTRFTDRDRLLITCRYNSVFFPCLVFGPRTVCREIFDVAGLLSPHVLREESRRFPGYSRFMGRFFP